MGNGYTLGLTATRSCCSATYNNHYCLAFMLSSPLHFKDGGASVT